MVIIISYYNFKAVAATVVAVTVVAVKAATVVIRAAAMRMVKKPTM